MLKCGSCGQAVESARKRPWGTLCGDCWLDMQDRFLLFSIATPPAGRDAEP